MHGNSCLKEKTKTPFYPSQLWRARDGKYRQRVRQGGSEVIYKMLNSVLFVGQTPYYIAIQS